MSGSATTSPTGGQLFDREALASLSALELSVVVGLTDSGLSNNEIYFGDADIVAGIGTLGGPASAVVVVGLGLSGQDNDTASGGAGNDQLLGMSGNDTLLGGDGNDLIYGNIGPINNGSGLINVNLSVTLRPDGADSLAGGIGDDSIFGNDGDDTVEGGAGADNMSGGPGSGDWLSFAGSLDPVAVSLEAGSGLGGDAAGDDFTGFENLLGGAGADVLAGDDAANSIDGANGDDTVRGDAGSDTLIGGIGADALDYSDLAGPVLIDLDAGSADDGLGGTDSIVGFEEFVLTGGADTVVAGAGEQDIDLGDGNDSFAWLDGDGDDTIRLGTGSDTLDLQGWTGTGTDAWDTQVDPGGSGATLFVNTGTGGDGADTLYVFGFDAANDAVTCFAEGTMVLTARGEAPIETLRAGDLVINMAQGGRPDILTWVGRTRIDLARQRNRRSAAPILIRAGALAPGVPCRDLRVSPEHALHLDGRLVPARLLVDGARIVQELWRREVTYYHLELAAHGLVVSDGAVTESYFDDGNRAMFDNAAIAALVVDFEAHRGNGRYGDAACAPILDDGPALDAIRMRIAARSREAHRAA